MSLLQSAALNVPAIRRLHDARNQMLIELRLTREALAAAEERARVAEASIRETVRKLMDGSPATPALAQPLPAAAAPDEVRALRAAYSKLEQDTAAMRLASRENRLFITDYAYFPAPRALDKAPGGQQVEAIFRRHLPSISATIQGIARHAEALGRIPREQSDHLSPFWANPWFPPFDGTSLYGILAETRPRRYIEVGSGISTRFARQAVKDLGLETRIISIDPHPHNAVEGLCDETIVQRAEDMPASFWAGLSADDMVFIDNSHRCFPGSDVTVFFTEVMPALPEGVVYGIHDIFLPQDYPAEWNDRFYSEHYLLMMYLLGGGGNDQILLPVRWASGEPDLHGALSVLWNRQDLFHGLMTHGGAFWARRGAAVA